MESNKIDWTSIGWWSNRWCKMQSEFRIQSSSFSIPTNSFILCHSHSNVEIRQSARHCQLNIDMNGIIVHLHSFAHLSLSLSLYSFSLSFIGHSARHLSDRFASSFTNNLESAWIIKQATRRESAAATVTIIIIQQQSLCNDSNGSHKLKGCHKQLQESHSVERTGYFGSVDLDWLRSEERVQTALELRR